MADQPNLYIPVHADEFDYPLPHIAERLARKGKVKIVAIGSSSTAGEGGIPPYPARLEEMMRQKYSNPLISVINQGIGGQEATDERIRMQDVIDEQPALTIWQVGTNEAWKGHDLDVAADAISQGLKMLKREPTDVILMDLQYTPALLAPDKIDAAERMQCLIDKCAREAGVGVFRRFEMMRKLIEIERRSFDALVSPNDTDRLHESDFVAQRIGYELFARIATAAKAALPGAWPPWGL